MAVSIDYKNAICKAIAERRLINLKYENDFDRTVEPHILGRKKNTHNDCLGAYLIGGYSESGELDSWRSYMLAKILSLSVLEQTFEGARPGYNPEDPSMGAIYCRLQD
jgi:hypothetical protein